MTVNSVDASAQIEVIPMRWAWPRFSHEVRIDWLYLAVFTGRATRPDGLPDDAIGWVLRDSLTALAQLPWTHLPHDYRDAIITLITQP